MVLSENHQSQKVTFPLYHVLKMAPYGQWKLLGLQKQRRCIWGGRVWILTLLMSRLWLRHCAVIMQDVVGVKLGEVWLGSLCIISNICTPICNYLKIKSLIKIFSHAIYVCASLSLLSMPEPKHHMASNECRSPQEGPADSSQIRY